VGWEKNGLSFAVGMLVSLMAFLNCVRLNDIHNLQFGPIPALIMIFFSTALSAVVDSQLSVLALSKNRELEGPITLPDFVYQFSIPRLQDSPTDTLITIVEGSDGTLSYNIRI
jgi:hypothetical protein